MTARNLTGLEIVGGHRPHLQRSSLKYEIVEVIQELRALTAIGVDLFQPIQFGSELFDALVPLFRIQRLLIEF